MNRLIKTTMLATVGMLLVAQGARAGTAGDLILGINNNDNGGTQDYIFDLGVNVTASGTISSTTGPIDLGISVASLQTALGSGISGWNAGVVAGLNGKLGNTGNFVVTSGAGAPSAVSFTQIGTAGGVGKGLATGGHTGLLLNSDPNSFTVNVAVNPTTPASGGGSFFAALGGVANPNADPLQKVGSSDSITLGLWRDVVTSGSGTTGWSEIGQVLLNFTGTEAVATVEPVAVPEPGTYGVIAAAGLLILTLRRQLLRNA